MSRKRKQPAPNILTPPQFLSSIVKLDILPESSDTLLHLNSHYNDNENATTKATAQKLLAQSTAEETTVFSNEAIEILRQCHGRFISLLSSELVSGERINTKHRNDDGGSTKRKGRKGKKAIEEDVKINNDQKASTSIRSLTSQSVSDALENLDFHSIASKIQCFVDSNKKKNKTNNDNRIVSFSTCNGSSVRVEMEQDTKKSSCSSTTIKCTKTRRKKMKKALKNDAMTAELLKEQERLFAQSVAKAKTR